MKEKLTELAQKTSLTKEDKELVKEITLELTNEKFTPPNSRCRNCYTDQIFKLLNFLKSREVVSDENKRYRLKDPHGKSGLNFGNGIIINDDNVNNYITYIKSRGFDSFLVLCN